MFTGGDEMEAEIENTVAECDTPGNWISPIYK